jgi:hypothetical protein
VNRKEIEMLKEQKNQVFVFGIVAILGISLATPVAKAALNIDVIYMTSWLAILPGLCKELEMSQQTYYRCRQKYVNINLYQIGVRKLFGRRKS